MEEKDNGWARFNALLEVAEEERIKYEKEKAELSKERRDLSIMTKFLRKIEKENSEMMNRSKRAAQSFELSTSYHKGKRSERKKISSTDTLKKLFPLPNSDENHQQKDGTTSDTISSREIIKVSSKKPRVRDEEEMMPGPSKAIDLEEEPVMAIPISFYCEGHYHQEKGRKIFNDSSRKRVREKGDQSETPKPKKARKVVDRDHNDEEPIEVQPLPEKFKNKIRALGGSESESAIKLVFEKKLTATDVSYHQSRLLIPYLKVKDHSFLTDEERELLGKRYNNVEKGIAVEGVRIPTLLIDPELEEHQMNLTRWDMIKKDGHQSASSNYSLITNWSKVVKKCQLKEGNFVQLWGFRKGSGPGMALVKV